MKSDRNFALIHDSYNCGKGPRMGRMRPWPTQRDGFLYVGYNPHTWIEKDEHPSMYLLLPGMGPQRVTPLGFCEIPSVLWFAGRLVTNTGNIADVYCYDYSIFALCAIVLWCYGRRQKVFEISPITHSVSRDYLDPRLPQIVPKSPQNHTNKAATGISEKTKTLKFRMFSEKT